MSKDKAANSRGEQEIIFGPFWIIESEEEISIHHEGLIKFLRDGGFFYLKTDDIKRLCRMQGKIIEEVDIGDVTQFIYNFIRFEVPEELGYGIKKNKLLNLLVRGIVTYINHPKLRLLPVMELSFHRDTEKECFFYCKNGVVKITADTITLDGYVGLTDYIWKKQIKPREFMLLQSDEVPGDFETFCLHVCNNDKKKFESLKTIYGYLLHRYWLASNPVIPCFLDDTTLGTEQAEGGTGKTLLCIALKYIRNMVDMDGKSFKPDGGFAYQRVSPDTEILFIDDLARNTSFESWFSIVTTGLEVNQKNKPAYKIPQERTPKIALGSNFPIKSIPGRSTERRKVEFECSQYYATIKPIEEFGKEFFTQWDETEFNCMVNFFARCVQAYLKTGIVTSPSETSALRQLISTVSIDLKEFLDDKLISRTITKLNKKDLYDEFLRSYPGQREFFRSPNRFILKVHKYLDYYKIKYAEIPAATRRIIEIAKWGEFPFPTVEDEPETTSFKTLSQTPHSYTVVEPTLPKDEPKGSAEPIA